MTETNDLLKKYSELSQLKKEYANIGDISMMRSTQEELDEVQKQLEKKTFGL